MASESTSYATISSDDTMCLNFRTLIEHFHFISLTIILIKKKGVDIHQDIKRKVSKTHFYYVYNYLSTSLL